MIGAFITFSGIGTLVVLVLIILLIEFIIEKTKRLITIEDNRTHNSDLRLKNANKWI